jgi:hypothetical protein
LSASTKKVFSANARLTAGYPDSNKIAQRDKARAIANRAPEGNTFVTGASSPAE